MNIQISDKAIGQLKSLGVGNETFLRVSVIPGGCSGMTYTAGVDDTLSDSDEIVLEKDSVRLVADTGSALFLDGLGN